MAAHVTKPECIQLILEHIGGKKIIPDPSAFRSSGTPVMVQTGASRAASVSVLAVINNPANTAAELFENPLEPDILDTIAALEMIDEDVNELLQSAMDSDLRQTLADSMDSATNALNALQDHTNALAGIGEVPGVSAIADLLPMTDMAEALNADLKSYLDGQIKPAHNVLILQQSLQNELAGLAGSLAGSKSKLAAMQKSLTTAAAGTIRDVLSKIKIESPLNTQALTPLVSTFASKISEFTNAIDAERAADMACQAAVALKVETAAIADAVTSVTSTTGKALLDKMATSKIRNLIGS